MSSDGSIFHDPFRWVRFRYGAIEADSRPEPLDLDESFSAESYEASE
jgi:hypothetical protein